jgi:hypothetical protein
MKYIYKNNMTASTQQIGVIYPRQPECCVHLGILQGQHRLRELGQLNLLVDSWVQVY